MNDLYPLWSTLLDKTISHYQWIEIEGNKDRYFIHSENDEWLFEYEYDNQILHYNWYTIPRMSMYLRLKFEQYEEFLLRWVNENLDFKVEKINSRNYSKFYLEWKRSIEKNNS